MNNRDKIRSVLSSEPQLPEELYEKVDDSTIDFLSFGADIDLMATWTKEIQRHLINGRYQYSL